MRRKYQLGRIITAPRKKNGERRYRGMIVDISNKEKEVRGLFASSKVKSVEIGLACESCGHVEIYQEEELAVRKECECK